MNHFLSRLRFLIGGALLVSFAGCTSSGDSDTGAVPRTARVHAKPTTVAAVHSPPSPLLQAALDSPTPPPIAPRQFAQLAQAQQKAALWANFVLRDVAKPLESGPGVVICEPVAGSAPDLAAFGSGCTRWLHLSVSGQGEMGKTPLWGAVDEARREMGRADLRLSKPQAAVLGRKLGLTHVVTATIGGRAAHCTLSLQLLHLPSLRSVGARVVASGTREEVVAQLPVLARKLCAQLGVSAPKASALAGASADDFAFVGRVPWSKSNFVPDEQTERLEKLSKRLSVAGMLWVYSEAVDFDESYRYRRVLNNIIRQSPGNVMALASSGWQASDYLTEHHAELQALDARFPHNYQLAATRRRYHEQVSDFDAQLKDGSDAVAAAPSNPLAWVALGSSFSNKAQSIRFSRFYDKMSASEQAAVQQLYPHHLYAALHATELDPRSSAAWSALSEAATFGGSAGIADLAEWKNIELDPDDPDAYDWGLQIYQPKWFPNRARLFKVVSLMAKRPAVLFVEAMPAMEALKEAGFPAESQQVLDLSLSQMQAEVRVHPRNVWVWNRLASVLDASGRYPEALRAYNSWLALEPRNLIAINNLGAMYSNNLNDQKANLALMTRAMRVDPTDPTFPFGIGKYYKDYEHNFDRAAPFFHQAMALDPTYVAPITGLANIYWFLKNDGATGERLFKQAIRLAPADDEVRAEYAQALLHHGRKAEALQQAQKAIALGGTDHPVFAELGLQP